MAIVDGKKIAGQILAHLTKEVSAMRRKPVLAVVLVGNDKPSQTYVRNKQAAAAKVGVDFLSYRFSASISETELITQIRRIQKRRGLNGVIIQLPLPKKFDKKKVLNALEPKLDVDCLSWVSLGKIMVNEYSLVPPSPAAILEILKFHKVNLKGKHVVVVGQGDLVGKPLTNLLVNKPVTLTVCNKDTRNLKKQTLQADILITGVGRHNLITADMIKKGAVVIDAGVTFVSGKMYGDIDFPSVSKKASLVTPTPGGVGPITVAKLLENTVQIAKQK